jgi:hypothetical protein
MPFGEDEWPVTDEAPRTGPIISARIGIAVLSKRRQMHRIPGLMRQQGQKVRRGIVKGDFQRVVIDDFEAYLVKVGNAVGVVSLGVFHHEKHIGILGGERGREDALVRFPKIARGDRVAVGPFRVLVQMERVHFSVGGNVPGLRHAGNRMRIHRVFRDEAFQQRHKDVKFLDAGHDAGVKVLGFGAVSDVKNLVVIARLGEGLAFGAAGQERKHRQRAEAKNQTAQRELAEFKLHCCFDT